LLFEKEVVYGEAAAEVGAVRDRVLLKIGPHSAAMGMGAAPAKIPSRACASGTVVEIVFPIVPAAPRIPRKRTCGHA
jgi:hypothetical protein